MSIRPGNFREILQEAYDQRVAQNPAYSLRAFSRFLHVESGTLSQMLRGKRQISNRTIDILGERLGISPADVHYYKNIQRKNDSFSEEHTELSSAAFRVIRDWYHFAIIELSRTKSFRPDPRWIAKRLGLTVLQVRGAIERLVKLGLIEVKSERDGSQEIWIDKAGHNTVNIPAKTDGARRELQRQILELAVKSLEDTPVKERDQTAMTLRFHRSRLSQAREYIKNFRREFTEIFQADEEGEDVYHLSISLYPVTRKIEDDLSKPNYEKNIGEFK